MTSIRIFLCGVPIACGLLLAQPLLAETKDVFAFIPSGGRTLLAQVVTSHPPASELQAILSGKHTGQEWLAYLKGKTKSVPALQKFSEQEVLTLADYLSFNMPLDPAQSPVDLAKADLTEALPPDGRDFALEKCQGCHIITVVITQVRPVPAWLGTLHKPSHIRIKLSQEQREALASYLVINGGIPIDQVPEELRAGGATY